VSCRINTPKRLILISILSSTLGLAGGCGGSSPSTLSVSTPSATQPPQSPVVSVPDAAPTTAPTIQPTPSQPSIEPAPIASADTVTILVNGESITLNI